MAENRNICRFVPVKAAGDDLHTINFVYEKNQETQREFLTLSAYTLALVADGQGVLHMMQGDFPLKPGTIFLTFPAVPFLLENSGGLHYLYVTFLGLRASQILERLKITKTTPVQDGFACLIPFWEEAITLSKPQTLDMLAESVLLYTFSHIGAALYPEEVRNVPSVLPVKKYIDSHYTDAGLSLENISQQFSYTPKYLSNLFKQNFHIGFAEYLQTLRMQHACELMQQGITSVQNVAYLSGYRDPLYFSRAFKKKMGVSPSQHIRQLRIQE